MLKSEQVNIADHFVGLQHVHSASIGNARKMFSKETKKVHIAHVFRSELSKFLHARGKSVACKSMKLDGGCSLSNKSKSDHLANVDRVMRTGTIGTSNIVVEKVLENIKKKDLFHVNDVELKQLLLVVRDALIPLINNVEDGGDENSENMKNLNENLVHRRNFVLGNNFRSLLGIQDVVTLVQKLPWRDMKGKAVLQGKHLNLESVVTLSKTKQTLKDILFQIENKLKQILSQKLDVQQQKVDVQMQRNGYVQSEQFGLNSTLDIQKKESMSVNNMEMNKEGVVIAGNDGLPMNMVEERMSTFTNKNSFFDDVLHKVVEKVRIQVGANARDATMEFNLKERGRLNVEFQLENGLLSGKIIVSNLDLKDLLDANLQVLKDRLFAKGIDVGVLECSLENQKHFGQFQQRFSKHFDSRLEESEFSSRINFLHSNILDDGEVEDGLGYFVFSSKQIEDGMINIVI